MHGPAGGPPVQVGAGRHGTVGKHRLARSCRFSLGLEPEPKPADIRKWDRKGTDIPDLLRETCILEPGKGNYAPRGAMRGRYLRLPKDGRWETVERDQVLKAKVDVAEVVKAGKAHASKATVGLKKASGEEAGTDTSYRETLYEAGGFE